MKSERKKKASSLKKIIVKYQKRKCKELLKRDIVEIQSLEDSIGNIRKILNKKKIMTKKKYQENPKAKKEYDKSKKQENPEPKRE